MIVDARVRLPADLRDDLRNRPSELTEQYDAVLDLSSRSELTLKDLEAQMAAEGVARALMHAEYELGDPADALNDAVAALVKEKPDRFSGVGTVSLAQPLNIMRMVAQTARCRREGMVGISLQTAFFHMPITDRRLYPVYATACENDLVVFFHTGVNYGRTHPMGNDHPMLLDEVACDFPDLKIVACHAGWPWTAEMAAVARKHPTVYLEFGGLAPKYVAAQGTGWEVIHRFMNSLLHEQVLFGTDWPVMWA